MKRGQGAQFNWVFILVAGVIILGFFSVFIFKYVELQNKKASFEVVRNFNTQLELLERTGVFAPDLIKLGIVSKMEFTCSGNDFLAIVNDHEDLAYSLGDKIVFAPDIIRDKNFGAWINGWNYPFLVSKFLYLTSSRNKYIFVGDAPEELNKIPKNVFNIEKTNSITSVSDPSNTKVVFFNENNNADELIKYENLEVIYIDTNEKKVTFYRTMDTYEYFGEAFLFGAIFAGSSENYKCALDNSLNRLSLISDIYMNKASLINTGECSGILNSITNGLNVYKNYEEGDEIELDRISEGLMNQNLEMHGKGCTALF